MLATVLQPESPSEGLLFAVSIRPPRSKGQRVRSRDGLRLQIGLHLHDRFPYRLFGAGSVTDAGQPAEVSCQAPNLGVGYLYLHFIVPLRVGIGAPMLARGFGCSKSFLRTRSGRLPPLAGRPPLPRAA